MYENFVGTRETVRNREVSVLERCPHGEVRLYLKGRFTVGKVTGNKFDPFQVAADMRVARDEQAAGSFAQEIALTNNKLHRRNPTSVRHRCAQRCDSDGADSNFTALTVTALGHQWL